MLTRSMVNDDKHWYGNPHPAQWFLGRSHCCRLAAQVKVRVCPECATKLYYKKIKVRMVAWLQTVDQEVLTRMRYRLCESCRSNRHGAWSVGHDMKMKTHIEVERRREETTRALMWSTRW